MEKHFSIRLKFVNIFMPIIGYLGLLITGTLFFLEFVLSLIFGDFSNWARDLLLSLWAFYLAINELTKYFNLRPEIYTKENGLKVKVFFYWFRWKLVSWEDIVSVELNNELYLNKPIWTISTKCDLKIRTSRKYGDGSGKQIMVTDAIRDREELIKEIEEKI